MEEERKKQLPEEWEPCTLSDFHILRDLLYPLNDLEPEKLDHILSCLHGSIERLSVDLYTLESHFLLELIQNAEDNTYEEGVMPEVIFEIGDNHLLMRNNERGWSKGNMRGICGVNKSTKKELAGFIGQKGIGFKSVFKASRTPHIFWNDLAFFFDEEPRPGVPLGYIYPHTEGIDKDGETEVRKDERFKTWTNIYLPFKNPAVKKTICDEISDENNPYQYLLLFLRKLKKITFLLPGKAPIVYEKKERGPLVTLGGVTYFISSRKISMRDIREPARIFPGYEPELLLALPLDTKKQEEFRSKGKLYSFLPTEMKPGFPFLINSDFVVVASRERADLKSSWNSRLLDNVAPLFCEAFLELLDQNSSELLDTSRREDPSGPRAWLYELLHQSNVSYEFQRVSNRIEKDLTSEEIIPAHSGVFKAPSCCFTASDNDRELLMSDFCSGNFPKELKERKEGVFIIPEWVQSKSFLTKMFSIGDISTYWPVILKDIQWVQGHYGDDIWFVEFISQHSYRNIRQFVPLEGQPHFATPEAKIFCRKAHGFASSDLPVLSHLRVVKISIADRIRRFLLASAGFKDILNSLNFAKELAYDIKFNGYRSGFDEETQMIWILQTFAENDYWNVLSDHQFPIVINGSHIPWADVIPFANAKNCLEVLGSDESEEWIGFQEELSKRTLPNQVLPSEQAVKLFPHWPSPPASRTNSSMLATLSWMKNHGCFEKPEPRHTQLLLKLLTWMKRKECTLVLPFIPFIPSSVGLVPPGLAVSGSVLEQFSTQLPVIEKEFHDFSSLKVNKLAKVNDLEEFLKTLKSAVPTPNPIAKNMAQYCYASLQNLGGFWVSLPKTVPIPYLSSRWIDSSSDSAFLLSGWPWHIDILEEVGIFNISACGFDHPQALQFLRDRVKQLIPRPTLLQLLHLLRERWEKTNSGKGKEKEKEKEKEVEKEKEMGNEGSIETGILKDQLCFIYSQLSDCKDLQGLENEEFIFLQDAWWRPGQLRFLAKRVADQAEKVKLFEVIEVRNLCEEALYANNPKIKELFVTRLKVPTRLTPVDYLDVLDALPSKYYFSQGELEEIITEVYMQLTSKDHEIGLRKPSKLYFKKTEFVSDFKTVFLPSKHFSNVEAPMVFLPDESHGVHLPGERLKIYNMLNSWGVRTLDQVIKDVPITTPHEVAEHEEVKEKLEEAFPRFLLPLIAQLLDPDHGSKAKSRLNTKTELAVHLDNLKALIQVEPSPLKKVKSIQQEYEVTDESVSLHPIPQKLWWDIKGEFSGQPAIYFVIDDIEDVWEDVGDKILDAILPVFQLFDQSAFHNFILLCKEICKTVEDGLKRWERAASKGIVVGSASAKNKGGGGDISMTLLTQNLSELILLSSSHQLELLSSITSTTAPSPSQSSTEVLPFNPKEMIEDETFVGAIDAAMAGIGSICLHASNLMLRRDESEIELHKIEKEKEKEKGNGSYQQLRQHAHRVIHLGGSEPLQQPSQFSPPIRQGNSSPSRVTSFSSPSSSSSSFKADLGRWGEKFTFSRVLPSILPQLLKRPNLGRNTTLLSNNNTIEMADDLYRVRIVWENEGKESYQPFDLRVEVSDGKEEQTFYVEVKTTTGDKRRFYLSANECQFALNHSSSYMIIRVNNAATAKPNVNIFFSPIHLFNIQFNNMLKLNTIVIEH